MVTTTTAVKYGIICGLIVVVGIFQIAGTATPHTVIKVGSGETRVRFANVEVCWQGSCSTRSVKDAISNSCGGFKSGSDAALAFAILAMLALFAALVLAVLVLIVKIAQCKMLTGAALGVSTVFVFIAWPISFALHSNIKCNGSTLSDAPDSIVGPSAPLLLISWLILLATLAVWFFVKESDQHPATSDPSAEHGSSNYAYKRTITVTTTTTQNRQSSPLY